MLRPSFAALALLSLAVAGPSMARDRTAPPPALQARCDAANPTACLDQARKDEGVTRKPSASKRLGAESADDGKRQPKAQTGSEKARPAKARATVQQNRR